MSNPRRAVASFPALRRLRALGAPPWDRVAPAALRRSQQDGFPFTQPLRCHAASLVQSAPRRSWGYALPGGCQQTKISRIAKLRRVIQPCLERKAFRFLNAFQMQIDVDPRPVKMVGADSLHAADLRHARGLKPWKVRKSQKMLLPVDQHPESMRRNVEDFSLRSAGASVLGFHLHVP